jgi:RTX calcium-binding nonapeptide repeat (4 copies)
MRLATSPHLATAAGAAFALAVFPTAPAAAATASYEDGLFRYRAQPDERVEYFRLSRDRGGVERRGPRVRVTTRPAPNAGPGCRVLRLNSLNRLFDVVCRVGPPGTAWPRYRLSFSDRADTAEVAPLGMHGVIFSGPGDDTVNGPAERVYGGVGSDSLTGRWVHGGPGDDFIHTPSGPLAVLRGGAGDDRVSASPGPGLVYGGPGSDALNDSDGRDMLVGGPGRDEMTLFYTDDSPDVVRARGGGRDSIECRSAPDRKDIFFVDAADRVDAGCSTARVVLTGRPRLRH